jgi:hypothetical protein
MRFVENLSLSAPIGRLLRGCVRWHRNGPSCRKYGHSESLEANKLFLDSGVAPYQVCVMQRVPKYLVCPAAHRGGACKVR